MGGGGEGQQRAGRQRGRGAGPCAPGPRLPRLPPLLAAVTVHCITSPTVRSVVVKRMRGCGQDWEAAVAASGIAAPPGGGGGG